MRFTRLIPALTVSMLLTACDEHAVTAPDPPQLNMHAGAPIEFPVFNQFPAVNPCTGLDIIVTVEGTGWFQPHPNNSVLRFRSTLTTSDGYTGPGVEKWMGTDGGPGGILKLTRSAVLANPSGSRWMTHTVLVLDFKTSPPTTRVDRFEATCIRP